MEKYLDTVNQMVDAADRAANAVNGLTGVINAGRDALMEVTTAIAASILNVPDALGMFKETIPQQIILSALQKIRLVGE